MKLTDIIRQIGDRVRLASRVTALTGGTKAVDAVVVTNGGSGYLAAPTVGFSGGGGSGAAGTAIISGGQVISVTMTAAGTGYTSAPAVAFTPVSGGTGAAATAIMLALNLDAIPTASLSIVPAPFAFLLLSSQLNCYLLRAGTDAESSPHIIRPDDYATTTNEKVWALQGANLNGLTLARASLLTIATGTNQRAGNATLAAGTVQVDNTTVTANTLVLMTRKTNGGTIGDLTYTLTPGTRFTINSFNILDTSVVSYVLFEVA